MRKPTIVVILLILHLLLLATYIFGAFTVWNLAHDPKTLADKNAADEVQGLMIGFWFIMGVSAITAIIAWSVGKMKWWSRWLGILFYGLASVTLIYGIATDGHFESDDLVAPVTTVILTVLFALPAMRRALDSKAPEPAPAS